MTAGASDARQKRRPIRITKRTVDALPFPEGGKREVHWDETVKGFGIELSSTGRRTYVLHYRMGGRSTPARRYTIGAHGSPWTPDTARNRALVLLAMVRTGSDPFEVDRSACMSRAGDDEANQTLAFGAYADRFIKRHVIANELRSRKDIEQTFDRDLKPWFKNKRVDRITKQEIKDLLAHVGSRSQPAANKAYKWLSRMFTWGIDKDVLEVSPMAGVKKPFKEGKRQRFLRRPEIKTLCAVVPQLTPQFCALYLLLLLTGQRLREVAGMRWSELDLDTGDWLIPGARTKNGLPHLVPLSRQIRAILDALAPPERRKGLVLTTNGRTPISGFSKTKARVDGLTGSRITEPWVVHDLRRTFSTMCAELRIPLEHVEATLNHVSGSLGGVAGVYNVYKYRAEKLRALQKWADTLEKIIGIAPFRLIP